MRRFRRELSSLAAGVAVLFVLSSSTWAQAQTGPVPTRLEELLERVEKDHTMLEDELNAAQAERLRNAERLTRLETLIEEHIAQASLARTESASLRERMRQLNDRLSDLLTTLLIGALTVIGVLLPLLIGLLRSQRSSRMEMQRGWAQLERTHARVEHVIETVNGNTVKPDSDGGT